MFQQFNSLIPLFSIVLGASIVGLFGRFLGRRGSILITISGLVIALVYSWLTLMSSHLFINKQVVIHFDSWFPVFANLNWSFTVDSAGLIMLVVVTTISFLVHLYSSKYMEFDPHVVRFFSYLSLFTTFMLILVLSGNFLMVFLGWEGVGVCSYLLINFWYTRLQANKAALKAMMVNRVGDVSLILAFSIIFYYTNSLNFSVLLVQASFNTNISILFTLSALFLLLAAVGKSAQLGLHTWLPDAMEGPTPVSALIHAATMVTAGVFLLIRTSLWLNESPSTLNVVILFGAVTAIFAGTVGLLQYDIKRVIAYSTCSQLGYMVLICGCSAYSLGLFHLFNHAFFKALLFLGAGSIIHSMSDEQDMRRYGALRFKTPVLYIAFLLASMALMGIPFLAGFYSKDSILELLASSNSTFSQWGYWLALAAAVMTVLYSFKIIYWTFYSSTTMASKVSFTNWHNSSNIELIVLSSLTGFSILIGYIFKDQFMGLGSSFFGNILIDQPLSIDAEFLPVTIKLLPLFFALLSLTLSYVLLIHFNTKFIKVYIRNDIITNIFRFLSHKWYFNLIYNRYISSMILNAGYQSFWIWDRWLLEQIRIKDLH